MKVLTHADLSLNCQLIGPALQPGVPPVALIHGLGANLAFWYLGALRYLGREQTYLLHDLRGHGASSMPASGYGLVQMAEDFQLLLDQLGIARAHVVGHSHGARVALVFALTHPERVESLTLADTQLRALQPPMRLGDWPHWPAWKTELAGRGVTQFPPEDSLIDFRLLAELGPRSAGGRGGQSLTMPDADPAAPQPGGPLRARRRAARAGGEAGNIVGETRRIDLKSRQMGVRGAERWQTLMETTQAPQEMHDESCILPEQLPTLTMPALLIYGQLSHCVPTADRLEQILPNARRLLVPGAGHFFPIVKPRLFARALRVFLAQVDADAGRISRRAERPALAQNPASKSALNLAPDLASTAAADPRLGPGGAPTEVRPVAAPAVAAAVPAADPAAGAPRLAALRRAAGRVMGRAAARARRAAQLDRRGD